MERARPAPRAHSRWGRRSHRCLRRGGCGRHRCGHRGRHRGGFRRRLWRRGRDLDAAGVDRIERDGAIATARATARQERVRMVPGRQRDRADVRDAADEIGPGGAHREGADAGDLDRHIRRDAAAAIGIPHAERHRCGSGARPRRCGAVRQRELVRVPLAARSQNRPCRQQHGDDRHECQEDAFHGWFSDVGPSARYQRPWARSDTPKVRPADGTWRLGDRAVSSRGRPWPAFGAR
jgi:hypothetical protein